MSLLYLAPPIIELAAQTPELVAGLVLEPTQLLDGRLELAPILPQALKLGVRLRQTL